MIQLKLKANGKNRESTEETFLGNGPMTLTGSTLRHWWLYKLETKLWSFIHCINFLGQYNFWNILEKLGIAENLESHDREKEAFDLE